MSSFADFQKLISQITTGDPSHASVELLLRRLDPLTAKYLELCAIPHQFDPRILRVLEPEMSAVDAKSRYEELSQLSCVSARPNALAVHDEARKYLFGRWLSKNNYEFKNANARLANYFTQTRDPESAYSVEFAQRQRMFHLIGEDQSGGVKEFERLCRSERSVGRLSECETLIALVREYKAVLSDSSSGIVLYHEAKLWLDRRELEKSEQLFREVLNNQTLSSGYHIRSFDRIGLIYGARRQWKEAIRSLQTAVRLAEVAGDQWRLSLVMNDLGATLRDSGDQEEGRRILKKAIQLADEVKNTSCVAAGYNSLGTLERRAGDIRKGIEQYEKSLSYLSKLHDELREAQVYNNLGAAYADLGDWATSEQMYQRSLELKREAGDSIGQARTLSNLVPVYQNLKLRDDAIVAASQSIAVFEELRDKFSAAVTTRNLAKVYREMELADKSRNAYSRAIELFREAGDDEQFYATKTELEAYLRPVGMPWWAWLTVGSIAIIFLGLVVLFVYLFSR